MNVDSFAFLPRSFRPLFENRTPLEGETETVWAPFEQRLADSTLALITSAGLYVEGEQAPFDAERERREPTWGDPTWRVLPANVNDAVLGMVHLHVNPTDVLADHNIALPTDRLAELVSDGIVGAQVDAHVSVMGYQEAGLKVWRTVTAPEIVAHLRDHGADGVVLAPV